MVKKSEPAAPKETFEERVAREREEAGIIDPATQGPKGDNIDMLNGPQYRRRDYVPPAPVDEDEVES